MTVPHGSRDTSGSDDLAESGPGSAPGAMTLLMEAARSPLDPGYEAAAARRARASGATQPTGAVRTLVMALVAVLAMGTVWAVRDLRAPAPEVLRARAVLEEEIATRSAAVRDLQQETAALGDLDALLTRQALAPTDPARREAARLGPLVGTAAVSGPGMRSTLTDSQRAAAAEPAAAERVQYVDLQLVINGLWEAGAEAIAVNGRRLTALSAIRFAGEAILVEITPLVGPYRVEAIGDPDAVRGAFAQTAAFRHLLLLRETYGIGVDVVLAERLELPAVSVPTLRVARPIDGA